MGSCVSQLQCTSGLGGPSCTHQTGGWGVLHDLCGLGLWGLESSWPIPQARQRPGGSSGTAWIYPPSQIPPSACLCK